MIDLVIYGSTEAVALQTRALRKLIDAHGLQINPSNDGFSEAWPTGRNDVSVCCNHLQVDATIFGADTLPNVKQFMIAAMKLVGVFDSCPEHTKREYWARNEATLAAQEVAS
jgi:hypothetical protein